MEIIEAESFRRSLAKLPRAVQQLYQTQVDRFRVNWRDPRLHTKRVRGLPEAYSFRVTRRYRALFVTRNQRTAVIFEIDHRKDIYR